MAVEGRVVTVGEAKFLLIFFLFFSDKSSVKSRGCLALCFGCSLDCCLVIVGEDLDLIGMVVEENVFFWGGGGWIDTRSVKVIRTVWRWRTKESQIESLRRLFYERLNPG